MRVTSLNHVGLEKATRFYIDLLGLEAFEKKPNWLRLPDGRMVHLMPATDKSNDGNDVGDLARHLALQVNSLEEVVATLIAEGLRPFQVELGMDGGRKELLDSSDLSFGIGTVFVSDPDGNIVEFVDVDRGIFKEVLGPTPS